MKNRKDFIKEYIKNNLNSANVEEVMNATFDFCNDFIETEDELPSEENGFFNKPVIMVLENIKKPNKYTAKIGKYYKDHLYNTNEEVFLWRSDVFEYGLNPENDEYKVIAWRPINFE